MRAEKHAGCVMNETRKHRAVCAADESMHVHGEQRRSFQSNAFHESRVFSLLPPRPRTYGLSFRGSELLGLQVQGFCCPLQQRPSSGRITHRVTPQSRGGREGSLTLLSNLKGRLERRAKPASASRTENRPEVITEGGASTVCHHTDPISELTETHTTPRKSERQALQGQSGATKVSQLHLYLPSSLCDDEEQDTEKEEMRTSVEKTTTQGSETNDSSVLINPSHNS
ncbi:uncharacterized protein LOC104937058 isoform X2 [Larimichthys crocea]|nr:uncharacterized protein LOC104937058 isoform X2 [Larimichthys crocea]